MPRKQAALEVNQFIGGLSSDSNPLQPAENTTMSEINMELLRDGSRIKRRGVELVSSDTLDSGVTFQQDTELAANIFLWENAGGDSEKSLYVTQVGNNLKIFDVGETGVDDLTELHSETLSPISYSTEASFTVIDGILVAATGEKDIRTYEYDTSLNTVTTKTDRLRIRDLFGVQAVISGEDLTRSANLGKRPSTTTSEHTYNLRNQTFGFKRMDIVTEVLRDPINSFVQSSYNTDQVFPANSDSIVPYLAPNANDSQDRLTVRYAYGSHVNTPVGVSEAPKGLFVIDALDRGASRLEEVVKLQEEAGDLTYLVTSLPNDSTPGGASCVGQFAGRVWYAGFPGEVLDGDSRSPKMSSYVLFSRVLNDSSQIADCYQVASPTSEEDPDLVATDGGFLRLDGAYGVHSFVNLGNSLFVMAANGVWRITGDEEGSFSAVDYQVNRVTDRGCVSGQSVVRRGNTTFYWGEDGIYYLSQNELGVWNSVSITDTKIQKLYVELPTRTKDRAKGFYDSFERKIRWLYTEEGVSKELIFNIDFSAFTLNETAKRDSGYPLVVSIGETSPYNFVLQSEEVVADFSLVTANGEGVFADARNPVSSLKEVIYLVISDITPTISFGFARYNSDSLYDWGDAETGVAYSAYITTSPLAAGEARYKKQVPYLTLFFQKTESGFNADYTAKNQSSCLLSSRWNWHNNASRRKWSSVRQAYRMTKSYMPDSTDDTFDDGVTLVSTRNKIRGQGHAVSFHMEAEPGKDLHIYGWAFNLQVNQNE